MRLFGSLVLGLGLAALLAPAALAQGPRGGGGFGGGPMLLSNKSVQQELKLDSEQIEKATKLSEELRTKSREARQQLQDVPQGERQAKMQELMKETNQEAQKTVKEILKPEQAKRFHQISLQARGVSAFADAHVQEKLKITDEQKTKLTDITKELGEKRREVMQANQGDFAAMRDKMAPITKEAHEKAAALLTADQKATWKDMLGEPFEVKYERPAN